MVTKYKEKKIRLLQGENYLWKLLLLYLGK